MKIFGRDPILWTTAIAAFVQFLTAYVFHLDVTAQGAAAAASIALFGIIGAVMLHDGTWAAATTTVIKTLIALGLALGLKLSPDLQSEIMLMVQGVLALLVRQQVTAPVAADGTRL